MKKAVPLYSSIWTLYKRSNRAELSTRAAALAYHTILGIVPTIGISFWYLSSVNVLDKYVASTRQFVISQLNVSASTAFVDYFDKLTKQVGGHSWGWIGLALLIYTVWGLISKFGDSLDFILTAQIDEVRVHLNFKWLALMARRTFVMLILPVALALSLAVSQWIRNDSILHYAFELKQVGPLLAMPLAWFASIVAMTLVYYFIPRVKVPWREAVRAALIVGPISEMIRYGFGFYNSYAVSVHKIYGVLAVIPLFILWVQIAWTLLLAGALFIRLKGTASFPLVKTNGKEAVPLGKT